jgi:hypothetical protein
VKKFNVEYKWLDLEKARYALYNVVSTLEECGVRTWLCFGTLLGFWRDGSFIVYDADIDLGTTYDGYKKIQEIRLKEPNMLRSKGIIMGAFTTGPDNVPVLMSAAHCNTKVDVYCWFENGDKSIHVVNYKKEADQYNCVVLPIEYHKNLEKVEFMGIECYTPSNPEELIKTLYGEDWRTRRKGGGGKTIRLNKDEIMSKEDREEI